MRSNDKLLNSDLVLRISRSRHVHPTIHRITDDIYYATPQSIDYDVLILLDYLLGIECVTLLPRLGNLCPRHQMACSVCRLGIPLSN